MSRACSFVTYQLKYVEPIRRGSGNVTTQEWEVDNWKVEIITFVVDLGVKPSINVNPKVKIQI